MGDNTSSRFTETQLLELEDKHVRIVHLKGPPTRKAIATAEGAKIGKSAEERAAIKPAPAWEVVFRKPTRLEYKAFRKSAHKAEQAADAQEVLARACVVDPDRKAFDALLEDYPAIAEAASEAFKEIVGLVGEESEKP